MDANNFVARLKANGTKNDLCDLTKVINEHKDILSRLPSKDRGSFCLNVLCMLCRNLNKVPSWRDNTDPNLLLTLSIDCVKETLALGKTDQVKILACVYHIHWHFVKLDQPIPPKLVLQLSRLPFQRAMLAEHCRTYWNVLADRITYMELLKIDGNISIIKLLPKLTEDILKLIQIYDTAQFYVNILIFLIKELHFLYSNLYSVELNNVYGKIFDSFTSKSDLETFKRLSNEELLDLYVKLNECFYFIIKNSSKNLKDSVLTEVVNNSISILRHCPDIPYCLKTFYLDSFCNIFKMTQSDCDIFKNLIESCEKTDRKSKIIAAHPFLNQMLSLYIDNMSANVKDHSKIQLENSREYCLKFILLIMKKSKNCNQLLEYDDCEIQNGLHDALRLSFLSINLVKLNANIDNILPILYAIIEQQHIILEELKKLGCSKYNKWFRKVQMNTHDTLKVLKESKQYEYSIKLLNISLKHEIKSFKDSNLENISRVLYNKSICESDCKKYEDALKNAFLSLVFAFSEGLNSDKHMSLVIDIKAKALKASEDVDQNKDIKAKALKASEDVDENKDIKAKALKASEDVDQNKDIKAKALKASEDVDQNKLQLLSVLEACKICSEDKWYGNLRPFYAPLKFSALLKQEFTMYCKLWPYIVAIAGVLRSMWDLARNVYACTVPAENEVTVMATLYNMILETSAVVNTVHEDHFRYIVNDVVSQFDEKPASSTELQMIQAAMLFLKAELDLLEASEKYGWEDTDLSFGPDNIPIFQTVHQEHEATRRAIQAVELMTDALTDITTVTVTNTLTLVLEIASIFVQQLLLLHRQTHGLQLAYICCVLAERIGDTQAYMKNAGVVISHADKQTDKQIISDIMKPVSCAALLADENPEHIDTAVVFICDVAIYKFRTGAVGAAAKLLQAAQTKIKKCVEKCPKINLDLAIGRVLEAQYLLCGDSGPGALSAVNFAVKHYFSMTNTASRRHSHRLFALTSYYRMTSSCAVSVRLERALWLLYRARARAATVTYAATAVGVVALHATTRDLGCVNSVNQLKQILGMQSNDACQKNLSKESDTKPKMFTAKLDMEVMLENMTLRKTQVSPSMPCVSVPGFKTPAFLKHTNCDCYACEIPQCYILSAFTVGLEAAMYFRATEIDIARNYFEGAFKCFQLAERKLKEFDVEKCDMFIFEVKRSLFIELKNYEVEMMIEAAFFELSVNNYEKADEIVVRIHDILGEYDIDGYLKNDVMNLMVASAEILRNVKKNADTSLEEFELKIPANMEPLKTPEIKTKIPPKLPKITVSDEELPKKRKVIKLNLDEADQKEKVVKKKHDFKIRTPATKLTMEVMTPRNTRSKPNISVTQPSAMEVITPLTRSIPNISVTQPSAMEVITPLTRSSIPNISVTQPSAMEVITPLTRSIPNISVTQPEDTQTPSKELYCTPSTSEKFFTPMSTLKTYAGKSLRLNIVKNLENEFSTPKGEMVPKSTQSKDSKNTLKRAASPETYAGKSLRHNIVKNLENEFSTPKGEMVPKSTKSKDSKNTLKRAASPETYAGKSLRHNIVKNLENEFSTPKGEMVPKSTKSKDSKNTLKRAASPETYAGKSLGHNIVKNLENEFSTPKGEMVPKSTQSKDSKNTLKRAASPETYAGKSLRHNIVKNLENEFSTPKGEMVPKSTKSKDSKNTLKRAASPEPYAGKSLRHNIVKNLENEFSTPKGEMVPKSTKSKDSKNTLKRAASPETYAGKSLRHNIVKNLENEFSTPKGEMVPKSTKSKDSKNTLKRAASPETYAGKSLRHNIVKNLENEFSTPKGEMVPKSTKSKDSKNTLKRAASPETYAGKSLRHNIVKNLENECSTPKGEMVPKSTKSKDSKNTLKRAASPETYAGKSLRHNIVKNLENEFSTPKGEMVPKSTKSKDSKNTLKRAASPETYAGKSLRHNIVKNLENECSTPKGKMVPKSNKSKDSKNTLKQATSPGKLKPTYPGPTTRRQNRE